MKPKTGRRREGDDRFVKRNDEKRTRGEVRNNGKSEKGETTVVGSLVGGTVVGLVGERVGTDVDGARVGSCVGDCDGRRDGTLVVACKNKR